MLAPATWSSGASMTRGRRRDGRLMHEYSLAQALIEHAEREVRARGAVTVRRLVVRIGPLAGVETDLFSAAYDHRRVGTLCAGADLCITGEEVDWRCDACGERLPMGATLCCHGCGLPGAPTRRSSVS